MSSWVPHNCPLQDVKWHDAEWGGLQAGQQMAKAQPVFQRLEGDFVIKKPAELAASV